MDYNSAWHDVDRTREKKKKKLFGRMTEISFFFKKGREKS